MPGGKLARGWKAQLRPSQGAGARKLWTFVPPPGFEAVAGQLPQAQYSTIAAVLRAMGLKGEQPAAPGAPRCAAQSVHSVPGAAERSCMRMASAAAQPMPPLPALTNGAASPAASAGTSHGPRLPERSPVKKQRLDGTAPGPSMQQAPALAAQLAQAQAQLAALQGEKQALEASMQQQQQAAAELQARLDAQVWRRKETKRKLKEARARVAELEAAHAHGGQQHRNGCEAAQADAQVLLRAVVMAQGSESTRAYLLKALGASP
jgi:hypothetical protein